MESEEQLVRRILDIIPPVIGQVLAGLEVLEKVFTTED